MTSQGIFLADTSEVAIGIEGHPTPTPPINPEDQVAQIDAVLRQTMKAALAYNIPPTMQLDDTATIELLINPLLSESQLAEQVTESGETTTSVVEITQRMKAVLLSKDQDAFVIQSLHDDPEQLISGIDTTKWSWSVTAKKEGPQTLTIIVSRLVKFDGKDYWREVETYKADIVVKVTVGQRVQAIDWKWIAGIIVPLIGIPALWRYIDSRKKKGKKRSR